MEQPADTHMDQSQLSVTHDDTTQTSNIEQQSINISHTYSSTQVIQETSSSQKSSEIIQEITEGIPKTASSSTLVTESEDEEWFVSEWSEDQSSWTVAECTKLKEAKHRRKKLKGITSSDLHETEEHTESEGESDNEDTDEESRNNTIIETERNIIESSGLSDQPMVTVTKTERTIITDSHGNKIEDIDGASIDNFLQQSGNDTVTRHESTVTTHDTEGHHTEVVTRVVKTTTITSYISSSEEQTVIQEESSRTETHGSIEHESAHLEDGMLTRRLDTEHESPKDTIVTGTHVIQDGFSQSDGGQQASGTIEEIVQGGTMQEITETEKTIVLNKLGIERDKNANDTFGDPHLDQRLTTDQEHIEWSGVDRITEFNIDGQVTVGFREADESQSSVIEKSYVQETIIMRKEQHTDSTAARPHVEEDCVGLHNDGTEMVLDEETNQLISTKDNESDAIRQQEVPIDTRESTQTLTSDFDTDQSLDTESSVTIMTITSTTDITGTSALKSEPDIKHETQHKIQTDDSTTASSEAEYIADANMETAQQTEGARVTLLTQEIGETLELSKTKDPSTKDKLSVNIIENDAQLGQEKAEITSGNIEDNMHSVMGQTEEVSDNITPLCTESSETLRSLTETQDQRSIVEIQAAVEQISQQPHQNGQADEGDGVEKTQEETKEDAENEVYGEEMVQSSNGVSTEETKAVQMATTTARNDTQVALTRGVEGSGNENIIEISRVEPVSAAPKRTSEDIYVDETITEASEFILEASIGVEKENEIMQSTESTKEESQSIEAISDAEETGVNKTPNDISKVSSEARTDVEEGDEFTDQSTALLTGVTEAEEMTSESTDISARDLVAHTKSETAVNSPDANIQVDVKDETIASRDIELDTGTTEMVNVETAVEAIEVDVTSMETAKIESNVNSAGEAENMPTETSVLPSKDAESAEMKTNGEGSDADEIQTFTTEASTKSDMEVKTEDELTIGQESTVHSTHGIQTLHMTSTTEEIDVDAKSAETTEVSTDTHIADRVESEDVTQASPVSAKEEIYTAGQETKADMDVNEKVSDLTETKTNATDEEGEEALGLRKAMPSAEDENLDVTSTAEAIDVDTTSKGTTKLNAEATIADRIESEEITQTPSIAAKEEIDTTRLESNVVEHEALEVAIVSSNAKNEFDINEEQASSQRSADLHAGETEALEQDTDANLSETAIAEDSTNVNVEVDSKNETIDQKLQNGGTEIAEVEIATEAIDADLTSSEAIATSECSNDINIEDEAEWSEGIRNTPADINTKDEVESPGGTRSISALEQAKSAEQGKDITLTYMTEVSSNTNTKVDTDMEETIAQRKTELSTIESETLDQEPTVQTIDIDANIADEAETADMTKGVSVSVTGDAQVADVDTNIGGEGSDEKSKPTMIGTKVITVEDNETVTQRPSSPMGEDESVEMASTDKGVDVYATEMTRVSNEKNIKHDAVCEETNLTGESVSKEKIDTEQLETPTETIDGIKTLTSEGTAKFSDDARVKTETEEEIDFARSTGIVTRTEKSIDDESGDGTDVDAVSADVSGIEISTNVHIDIGAKDDKFDGVTLEGSAAIAETFEQNTETADSAPQSLGQETDSNVHLKAENESERINKPMELSGDAKPTKQESSEVNDFRDGDDATHSTSEVLTSEAREHEVTSVDGIDGDQKPVSEIHTDTKSEAREHENNLIQAMYESSTEATKGIVDESKVDSTDADAEVSITQTEIPFIDVDTYVTQTETPSTEAEESITKTETPSTDTDASTTQTETPSTDAEKSITQTETPSTDTDASPTQHETPSTDAEESITQTETPSTDADESITQTERPFTDSEESITQAGTPSTEADESITQTETPSTYAEATITQTEPPSTDADESITQSERPFADAEESITQTETPSTDAETTITQTEPPSTDTEKSITQTGTPSTEADESITQTEPPSTGTDESITQTGTPSTEADESITQTETPSTNADESITQTETLFIDGEESITQTETPSTDAEATITQTEPASTDAEESITQTERPFTNAEESITQTETASTDAEATITQTEPPSTDAEESITQTERPFTDAEENVKQTETASTDAEATITQTEPPSTDAEESLTQTERPFTDAEESIKQTETSSTDAEAIITQTEPPSTDAEESITQTERPFTDAEENVKQTETASTDAEATITQTEPPSADAEESLTQTKRPFTDAEESIIQTETASTDAEATITQTEPPSTDAEESITQTERPFTDATESITQTETASTDTDASTTQTETPSTDAAESVQQNETPSTDTEAPITQTEKTSTDAEASITQLEPSSIDVEAYIIQTKTPSTDAEESITQNKILFTDADTCITQTETPSPDADTSTTQTELPFMDADTSITKPDIPSTVVVKSITQTETSADAETTDTRTGTLSNNAEASIIQTETSSLDAETSTTQTGKASTDIETPIAQTETPPADAESSITQNETTGIGKEPSIMQSETPSTDFKASITQTETASIDTSSMTNVTPYIDTESSITQEMSPSPDILDPSTRICDADEQSETIRDVIGSAETQIQPKDSDIDAEEQEQSLDQVMAGFKIQKEVAIETKTSFKETIEIQKTVVAETRTSHTDSYEILKTSRAETKETISTNGYDVDGANLELGDELRNVVPEISLDGDEGFDEFHDSGHQPAMVDLQINKLAQTNYHFASSKEETVDMQDTAQEQPQSELARTLKDKFKVVVATERAEIDMEKPIYIFVLNSGYEEKSQTVERIRNHIQKEQDTADVLEPPGMKAAIRGSAKSFGTWRLPKQAVRIDEDCYALLINDNIPKFSQYKWLDMSAGTTEGNQDPTTGFIYEPAPFVDRICEFQECKAGEEVAVVSNKWADYSYTVNYTDIEDWDMTQLQKLNTGYPQSVQSSPELKRKWSDIDLDVIKPVGAGIQLSEAVGRDIRETDTKGEVLSMETRAVDSELSAEPPGSPSMIHGKRELEANDDSVTIKKAKTDPTEIPTDEGMDINDDTADESKPSLYDSFIKFLNIPTSRERQVDTLEDTHEKKDIAVPETSQQEKEPEDINAAETINKRDSIDSYVKGTGNNRRNLTEEAQFLGIDEGVITNDSLDDSILDKAKEFFNIPEMSDSSESETKDISLEDRSRKPKPDFKQTTRDGSENIEYKETKFTQAIRTETTLTVGKMMDMGRENSKSPTEEAVAGGSDLVTTEDQTPLMDETTAITHDAQPEESQPGIQDDEDVAASQPTGLTEDKTTEGEELDKDKQEELSFFQRIKNMLPDFRRETDKDDDSAVDENNVDGETKLDAAHDDAGKTEEIVRKQDIEIRNKEEGDYIHDEEIATESGEKDQLDKEIEKKRERDIDDAEEKEEEDGGQIRGIETKKKYETETEKEEDAKDINDEEIGIKMEEEDKPVEDKKEDNKYEENLETEEDTEDTQVAEDKQDVEKETKDVQVAQSEERQTGDTDDMGKQLDHQVPRTESLATKVDNLETIPHIIIQNVTTTSAYSKLPDNEPKPESEAAPGDETERVHDIIIAETTTTSTSAKPTDSGESKTKTEKPSVLQDIFQIPLFKLPGAEDKMKEERGERTGQQSNEDEKNESESQSKIDHMASESKVETKTDLIEKVRSFFSVPEKVETMSDSKTDFRESQSAISDDTKTDPMQASEDKQSQEQTSINENNEDQSETAYKIGTADKKESNGLIDEEVKSVKVNFTEKIKSLFKADTGGESKTDTVENTAESEASNVATREPLIPDEGTADRNIEEVDDTPKTDVNQDKPLAEEASSDVDFVQKFKAFFHSKTKDNITEKGNDESATATQKPEEITADETQKGRLIQNFTKNVENFLNVPQTDNTGQIKQQLEISHEKSDQHTESVNDFDSFYTADEETIEKANASQKVDDDTTETEGAKTSLIQTLTEKVGKFLNVPESETTDQAEHPEQLSQTESDEIQKEDSTANLDAAHMETKTTETSENEQDDIEPIKGNLIHNFTEKVGRFLNFPERDSASQLESEHSETNQTEENEKNKTTEKDGADVEPSKGGLTENLTGKIERLLNIPEQDYASQIHEPEQNCEDNTNKREEEENVQNTENDGAYVEPPQGGLIENVTAKVGQLFNVPEQDGANQKQEPEQTHERETNESEEKTSAQTIEIDEVDIEPSKAGLFENFTAKVGRLLNVPEQDTEGQKQESKPISEHETYESEEKEKVKITELDGADTETSKAGLVENFTVRLGRILNVPRQDIAGQTQESEQTSEHETAKGEEKENIQTAETDEMDSNSTEGLMEDFSAKVGRLFNVPEQGTGSQRQNPEKTSERTTNEKEETESVPTAETDGMVSKQTEGVTDTFTGKFGRLFNVPAQVTTHVSQAIAKEEIVEQDTTKQSVAGDATNGGVFQSITQTFGRLMHTSDKEGKDRAQNEHEITEQEKTTLEQSKEQDTTDNESTKVGFIQNLTEKVDTLLNVPAKTKESETEESQIEADQIDKQESKIEVLYASKVDAFFNIPSNPEGDNDQTNTVSDLDTTTNHNEEEGDNDGLAKTEPQIETVTEDVCEGDATLESKIEPVIEEQTFKQKLSAFLNLPNSDTPMTSDDQEKNKVEQDETENTETSQIKVETTVTEEKSVSSISTLTQNVTVKVKHFFTSKHSSEVKTEYTDMEKDRVEKDASVPDRNSDAVESNEQDVEDKTTDDSSKVIENQDDQDKAKEETFEGDSNIEAQVEVSEQLITAQSAPSVETAIPGSNIDAQKEEVPEEPITAESAVSVETSLPGIDDQIVTNDEKTLEEEPKQLENQESLEDKIAKSPSYFEKYCATKITTVRSSAYDTIRRPKTDDISVETKSDSKITQEQIHAVAAESPPEKAQRAAVSPSAFISGDADGRQFIAVSHFFKVPSTDKTGDDKDISCDDTKQDGEHEGDVKTEPEPDNVTCEPNEEDESEGNKEATDSVKTDGNRLSGIANFFNIPGADVTDYSKDEEEGKEDTTDSTSANRESGDEPTKEKESSTIRGDEVAKAEGDIGSVPDGDKTFGSLTNFFNIPNSSEPYEETIKTNDLTKNSEKEAENIDREHEAMVQEENIEPTEHGRLETAPNDTEDRDGDKPVSTVSNFFNIPGTTAPQPAVEETEDHDQANADQTDVSSDTNISFKDRLKSMLQITGQSAPIGETDSQGNLPQEETLDSKTETKKESVSITQQFKGIFTVKKSTSYAEKENTSVTDETGTEGSSEQTKVNKLFVMPDAKLSGKTDSAGMDSEVPDSDLADIVEGTPEDVFLETDEGEISISEKVKEFFSVPKLPRNTESKVTDSDVSDSVNTETAEGNPEQVNDEGVTKDLSISEKVKGFFAVPTLSSTTNVQVTDSDTPDTGDGEVAEGKLEPVIRDDDETNNTSISEKVKEFFTLPKMPSTKGPQVTDSDAPDSAEAGTAEDKPESEIKDDKEEAKDVSISEKVKEFFALPKMPSTKESQIKDSDTLDSANADITEDKPEDIFSEADKEETKHTSISEKVKRFFALPKSPSSKESQVIDSDKQVSADIVNGEGKPDEESQKADKVEEKDASLSEKVKEFFVLPKLQRTKESLVIDSDKPDSADIEDGEDKTEKTVTETDKDETKGIPISEKVKEFFTLPKLSSTKVSSANVDESEQAEAEQNDIPPKEDEVDTNISTENAIEGDTSFGPLTSFFNIPIAVETKDEQALKSREMSKETQETLETKETFSSEITITTPDQKALESQKDTVTGQELRDPEVSEHDLEDPDKPLGDKVKAFFNIPKDNADASSGISDNSNEVSRLAAQKLDENETEEQSSTTIFDKIKNLVQSKQTSDIKDEQDTKDVATDETVKEGDNKSSMARMKEIFSSNAEDDSEIKTTTETEEIQSEINTEEEKDEEKGILAEIKGDKVDDESGDKSEIHEEESDDKTATHGDGNGDKPEYITETKYGENVDTSETKDRSNDEIIGEDSTERSDIQDAHDSDVALNEEDIDAPEAKHTIDAEDIDQTSDTDGLREAVHTEGQISAEIGQDYADDETTEEQEVTTEFHREEVTITLDDIDPISIVECEDTLTTDVHISQSQVQTTEQKVTEEEIVTTHVGTVSTAVVTDVQHMAAELHTEQTETRETSEQQESEIAREEPDISQFSEENATEIGGMTQTQDIADCAEDDMDLRAAEDDLDDKQGTDDTSTGKDTEDGVDKSEETQNAGEGKETTEFQETEATETESEQVIASTSYITGEKESAENDDGTDEKGDDSERVEEKQRTETESTTTKVNITQHGVTETKTTKIEIVEKSLIQRIYGSFKGVTLTHSEKEESINNNENDNSTQDDTLQKEGISKHEGESDETDFWRIFFNIPKEPSESIPIITDTEQKTVEGTSL